MTYLLKRLPLGYQIYFLMMGFAEILICKIDSIFLLRNFFIIGGMLITYMITKQICPFLTL